MLAHPHARIHVIWLKCRKLDNEIVIWCSQILTQTFCKYRLYFTVSLLLPLFMFSFVRLPSVGSVQFSTSSVMSLIYFLNVKINWDLSCVAELGINIVFNNYLNRAGQSHQECRWARWNIITLARTGTNTSEGCSIFRYSLTWCTISRNTFCLVAQLNQKWWRNRNTGSQLCWFVTCITDIHKVLKVTTPWMQWHFESSQLVVKFHTRCFQMPKVATLQK